MPLATGFLWLVFLWLIAYSEIPSRDAATGLFAEVYKALGAFGSAAPIAVVTFTAYLIGVVLVRPGSSVVQFVLRRIGLGGQAFSTSSVVEAEQLARHVAAAMDSAGVRLPGRSGDDNPQDIVGLLTQRMADEVPLVATRLLAENRELFDRYDRADAEAAFRFAVPLPLIAISVASASRAGLEWWGHLITVGVAVVVAALLLIEGARKRMESNDAIYQAVFAGTVAFPSVETALAAVAEELERREKRRADHARTTAARRDAEQTARDAESRALAEARAEASLVTVGLRGGAGFGPPGDQKLTSVHVDLVNDTTRAVVIERFELNPPLLAKRYPAFPIRLAANETRTETVDVQPIDIESSELSGAPLQRFNVTTKYRLGNASWSRTTMDDATPTR